MTKPRQDSFERHAVDNQSTTVHQKLLEGIGPFETFDDLLSRLWNILQKIMTRILSDQIHICATSPSASSLSIASVSSVSFVVSSCTCSSTSCTIGNPQLLNWCWFVENAEYEVWLIRSQTAFFCPTFVSWPSLSTICCNLPWPCTSSSPSWKFQDDYIPNDSMGKISFACIFSIAPLLKRTLSWYVNCHFMLHQ